MTCIIKLFTLSAALGLVLLTPPALQADDIKTLPIGSPAPDFKLKGVDGKWYSIASFKDANILVIVFTCNHCPTAQAYEDRIIQLTSDYTSKKVAVVAINPNDPRSLRLDELDFSDIGDSYEEMKMRASDKNFNFPYLYDGDSQKISKLYGPIATPHVFVFDKERKLRYSGRFDDMESPFKKPRSEDTRNAIDALLAGHEVPVQMTKVFGCSIKWTEKSFLVQQYLDKWAKESVSISALELQGMQDLLHNSSDKLRLIYFWSLSGKLDTTQFHEFVNINRMYRDRDFEFISICAGEWGEKENALEILKRQQASNINYLSGITDKQKLRNMVDRDWNGDMPYTILVEPGGKIVYAKQGAVDPALLKRTIVNNHLIGKYP
jgi:glutathione peroxidase-family protein